MGVFLPVSRDARVGRIAAGVVLGVAHMSAAAGLWRGMAGYRLIVSACIVIAVIIERRDDACP